MLEGGEGESIELDIIVGEVGEERAPALKVEFENFGFDEGDEDEDIGLDPVDVGNAMPFARSTSNAGFDIDTDAEAEADANASPRETARRSKERSMFASTRSLELTAGVAIEAAGELATGAAALEPALGMARLVPAETHSCWANAMVSKWHCVSLISMSRRDIREQAYSLGRLHCILNQSSAGLSTRMKSLCRYRCSLRLGTNWLRNQLVLRRAESVHVRAASVALESAILPTYSTLWKICKALCGHARNCHQG